MTGGEKKNMINIKEILYETARQAHIGTSFDPEKRAGSIIESYQLDCNNSIQAVKDAGLYNEENKEIIQGCFDYYHKIYIEWLNKKSRCMSTMITGSANFPVRSNQKKLDSEHKALELLCNYSIIGEIRKRINRIKKKEIIQDRVESGDFSIHIIDQKPGIKIVNNTALERVQIFFDEKPDEDMRNKLKQHAFWWTPSLGTWQRKNTSNGIWAAKSIFKDIK